MTKQIRIYLFLFLATLLAGLPTYGQVGSGIITMTTAKNNGEKIRLKITADGDFRIDGVEEQRAQGYNDYTITNQQIVIRGNVTELECESNQLTALDVSGCTALTKLSCFDNQLTALDVSGCTALTTLSCFNNQLTALDASGCIALTTLDCYSNQLTALDVSGCTALNTLDCWWNELTKLDVSGCTALTKLSCFENQLTALDASGCIALTELECERNQLTALDVSGCTALTKLDCYSNQLKALDVSKNTALTKLSCTSNQLTKLDVSKNAALTTLDCTSNKLTKLDVSKNAALTTLDCNSNQLTALDVSCCTALTTLNCSQNQLTALDVSKNTALTDLNCSGNQIKGEEMTRLMNSLPDRTDMQAGKFVVIQSGSEGNRCLKKDVAIAKGKKWYTYKFQSDTYGYVPYEGEEPIPYAVTFARIGEGTLTATGADNLDAVPEGTELTIVATPAPGYELTALTANGTDILSTRKVVVKEATEVKATFAKKTFAVTLTKEGEGTLNATGTNDLNAVEYGTELTIEATSAEGYYLMALTANGTDILATRKVIVKESTEVKAIFVKKTFTVTLTKEAGEGTLKATGADNLNAVEYGTELTIDATPAEGYTLTALTANGTDILTAKKFVVKGATEIKATFTKKTAADRMEAGSVRLYPNPASTYVNVKATKADALVRLYDANGMLLYEARTDAHGMLQIELSAYAEGTYLLLVDGNAQRLLIQR